MTEQTQPTDAEIEAAWTDATGSSILPYPDDMLAFARAVLAKWGTPAGAGEVVAWGIFDSQGFYEAASDQESAERFCAHYNKRKGADPLKPYTAKPLYTTPQPTQAQAVVEVPALQQELVGDASMAHEQCRAVVHLALMLAEVYAANAAIVAHNPNLADQIGYASAQALEWIGDELNATDATTEDDEWVDPIIEAAQERWPTMRQANSGSLPEINEINDLQSAPACAWAAPLTESQMSEGWRKFQEDLEARMAADPAGVRSMGREHWLSWAHWKAACHFARSHKGADHG